MVKNIGSGLILKNPRPNVNTCYIQNAKPYHIIVYRNAGGVLMLGRGG